MAQASFYKITKQKLDQLPIREGQVIFVEDTSALYIDKATGRTRINAENFPYTEIRTVKDYLYEIFYDYLDYEYASTYFKEGNDIESVGACTAVRKGNWYGRNYDWIYNEDAEFLIRVSRSNGRYASMGVASGIKGLTNDIVATGEYNESYKILPFYTVDGINEYGVVVNTNVVPLDKEETTKTIPTETEEIELGSRMIPRYILDHFKTAAEAVTYLTEHVSIYITANILAHGYSVHYMIADKNNTYLVEIIGNEIVITDMSEDAESALANKAYMTNFYLSDIVLNSDGTVYTPETQDSEHDAITTNLITEHGCGLERYNLVANNYSSIVDKTTMRAMMNSLKYTNSYNEDTDPFWYTEFVGLEDLTVTSTISEYEPIIEDVIAMYDNRTRTVGPNYGTWQTTHSAIYDIENRKMYIIVQEDGEELEYGFDFYINNGISEATDTITGGIKVRLDGSTLYMTNDGSDA